ncbi:Dynein regulatory complex subunit 3 [Paragonimus heterotremus]|uniref:Dynein regulatory complex subunit 3 n=1 Tax=Paragonimus heterotremus TaxID=100268 RepID=A0A8J4TMB5_9TREM|nr:Dynein regulatory complex subunit 3 [Paragonimus heterotremus]
MSRLYDTVEPSVVDRVMLETAIYEQGPKGEAGTIAKKEGVMMENVLSLRLDYQNILKIDNLWRFKNLVKLQLDNNIIEQIEGLNHLVQLKWLDLSFNNIEEISGLDSLINLEDLSLYNNRISKLENMDKLRRLQIIYLRIFPQLQSLCIRGNPLCDEEEFSLALCAYLPNLVYVDYKRTDDSLKAKAYEKYQLKIDELVAQEAAEKETEIRQAEIQQMLTIHRQAFVQGLDSDLIFETLYVNDHEGREFLQVPEFAHSIETYPFQMNDYTFSAAFTKECKAVFQLGLEELTKLQVELNDFWFCVDKTKQTSEREGRQKIEEFKVYQQETAKELENNTDTIMMEYTIKDYIERVQKLRYDLMHIEMTLVEQLDEVINEFNRNMKDMIDTFLEKVEEHFAECREQQSQFNERLTDISPSVLDRFLRTDSDVVASDDLLSIFGDKESLTNALQASNDAHLLQIDNLADMIIKQARDWYEEGVNYISEKEGYERNRKRVMEINQVADAFRDYVENMEVISSVET